MCGMLDPTEVGEAIQKLYAGDDVFDVVVAAAECGYPHASTRDRENACSKCALFRGSLRRQQGDECLVQCARADELREVPVECEDFVSGDPGSYTDAEAPLLIPVSDREMNRRYRETGVAA